MEVPLYDHVRLGAHIFVRCLEVFVDGGPGGSTATNCLDYFNKSFIQEFRKTQSIRILQIKNNLNYSIQTIQKNSLFKK